MKEIITDVGQGTVVKVTSICGDEDEIQHDSNVDKDEDGCGTAQGEGIVNRTSEFLVRRGAGRTEFNDTFSNGFANEDNVDLVLVFGLLVW